MYGMGTGNTQQISYNARQAAAMTGVSYSQITSMVRDGKLAKVPHLGTAVVISHAELERVFGHVGHTDQLTERRAS
jgi:hypothetical protein